MTETQTSCDLTSEIAKLGNVNDNWAVLREILKKLVEQKKKGK